MDMLRTASCAKFRQLLIRHEGGFGLWRADAHQQQVQIVRYHIL
jgi:hypothetical protein